MANFPTLLKPVVSQGYSFGAANNVLIQPVAGGLPLMILDYKTAAVAFDVSLILTPLRMQVWQDFYYSTIASGTASFNMNLDSGNGIESHVCKINPETVNHNSDNTQFYIVTFTVIAEKTPAQDEPFGGVLAELFDIYGDDVPAFLGVISEYSNNYLPDWWTP